MGDEMSFFELIKKRVSIRSFRDRPIPEEHVQKLLKAANQAPSAGNLQAYEVVVVTNSGVKEDLVKASHGQKFVGKAPVVFAFLQDEERSREKYGDRARLYSIQDGTISATYLQLAAVELGLGSCWVGAFNESEVAESLGTTKRPIALIPVGYPSRSSSKDSPRREIEDLVRFLD